ncbi:hypothetical protein J8273_8402 [Carpediemonas membranifera]|uniref:Uncharacterized protein n=1 Tax=Carpediemonas membranifera TaxID=201153 RepID=A0A8J6APP7_9EUKA|nr:hypothetical protein J8273_8402 [Carpediemonas membranifera]|eukprot:KAG9389728.1 hypothetical protein J8273_8402 [Carpediemonas membranifera]
MSDVEQYEAPPAEVHEESDKEEEVIDTSSSSSDSDKEEAVEHPEEPEKVEEPVEEPVEEAVEEPVEETIEEKQEDTIEEKEEELQDEEEKPEEEVTKPTLRKTASASKIGKSSEELWKNVFEYSKTHAPIVAEHIKSRMTSAFDTNASSIVHVTFLVLVAMLLYTVFFDRK